MRLTVLPTEVAVVHGEDVVLSVAITNTTEVISGHVVRVLGVDPRWVTLSEERLSLFPGASGEVLVTLSLPPGLLAGRRRVTVQVRELTGAGTAEVVDVDLVLPVVQAVEARLEPSSITAGRAGSFGLLVTNTGNAAVVADLFGSDEEERVRFRFSPAQLALDPGEHAVVEVGVRARRPVVGAMAVRPLALRVADAERPDDPPFAAAVGALVQRPLLGRGAFSLVGLLAAVTVFALVITYALSGVVGRSAADRDLALQVASASGTEADAAGTAALSGTVRLLTAGTPVSGVTVEVVSAADTASVLASVATGDDGLYTLSGLAAGSYKLRYRGAGFAELWFPSSLSEAEASSVDVQAGATKAGLDVRLGGLPASITGTVGGTDPAGAQVSLLLPGTAPPVGSGPTASTVTAPATGSPVVASVQAGADGGFAFAAVPSPGVYDLQVSKPGFATQVERLDVTGGEQRTGVALELLAGDGLLAGTVRDADSLVEGASVSVQYGTTTLRTVTGADGAFSVPRLPTPQDLVLVVSADGAASQTLSLSLVPGQQLTGLAVTLTGTAGQVQGVARLPGGAPAPGTTVLLTNGVLTLQTVTSSTASGLGLGAWSLSGLPVPGTYTATFSRADLVPQTLGVSLDASGRVVGGARLDVVLRPATLDLEGVVRVRDADGRTVTEGLQPITVTLASATQTYTVKAVSGPSSSLGRWRVDRVVPGTYTLTATARGSRPTSRIVSFLQGQQPAAASLRLDLPAPAAITATVRDGAGDPVEGATVRLYLAARYPSDVLDTGVTDARGVVRFRGLDAPERYVLDYLTTGTETLASSTVELAESQDLAVLLGEGR